MDVDVDPEALTWHGGQILINMRIIILCAIVELCSKVVGLQRGENGWSHLNGDEDQKKIRKVEKESIDSERCRNME